MLTRGGWEEHSGHRHTDGEAGTVTRDGEAGTESASRRPNARDTWGCPHQRSTLPYRGPEPALGRLPFKRNVYSYQGNVRF